MSEPYSYTCAHCGGTYKSDWTEEEEEADLRVLALGAGVQSTALLYMNVLGRIKRPATCAIFADTGWEPPAVYDHVKHLLSWVRNYPHFDIHVTSVGNIRDDFLNNTRCSTPPLFTKDEAGKMGMIKRSCTRDYKMRPLARKMRELCGIKPRGRMDKKVEVQIGISFDELHRMKDAPRETPWQTMRYPLVDAHITRDACLQWLGENGFSLPVRSSCVGCPYHSDRFWLEMKKSRPEEWNDAVEFDTAIRYSRAAGVKGELFLHRSGLPLAEADLGENQLDLFEDCGGYCFT